MSNGALIRLVCIAYILFTSAMVHEGSTPQKLNPIVQSLVYAMAFMCGSIIFLTWKEEDTVDIRWGMCTFLYTTTLWIRWGCSIVH